MKAAVFKKGGEPWVVETMPDPVPGPGEMVIKVGRCGICGSDIHLTSGEGFSFPHDSVLGHEYAGEVMALGPGVKGFRIGDFVTAMPATGCGHCERCRAGNEFLCQVKLDIYMGGFAEYARIPAKRTIRLPATLSVADGALVEPLAVGLHAVSLAQIPQSGRALVLGAGPIGLATVFALRRLGLRRIAVASRSQRRAVLAEKMGAEAFILTGDDEVEKASISLGGEPDVVFECIGVAGALNQSIRLVRADGLVVSLGNCVVPDSVSVGVATSKQARLIFSMGYTLQEFQCGADYLAAGHIEPREMITEVISLAETPDAIEKLRVGARQTKVQVDPGLD